MASGRKPTAEILRNLELWATTGIDDAALSDMNTLNDLLRNPSEIVTAVKEGLLEVVQKLLSSNNSQICLAATQVVGEAVANLVMCGDANPRLVDLSETLLKFLRENILTAPGREPLAEPVFRALLRATEGTLSYKRVVLKVFPLRNLRNILNESHSPTSLDELTSAIDNLCERSASLVDPVEIVAILGGICGNMKIRCRTISKICARLRKIINVQDPLPLIKLIRSTALVAGAAHHVSGPRTGCKAVCLNELMKLLPHIIISDEGPASALVCGGVLRITMAAFKNSSDEDLIAGCIKVVSRCLACGSSLTDAILNHDLIRCTLFLILKDRADIRADAVEAFENFLRRATASQLIRACNADLGAAFSLLITSNNESVRYCGLTLLEKLLDAAASRNIEYDVTVGLCASSIPLSIRTTSGVNDERSNRIASILAVRLDRVPELLN